MNGLVSYTGVVEGGRIRLLNATLPDGVKVVVVALETLPSVEEQIERQGNLSAPQDRPENKRALALLDEWMSEPDDLGEDWWAEFEMDLREHRLAFRNE